MEEEAKPVHIATFRGLADKLGYQPISRDPKYLNGPERYFSRPLPTVLEIVRQNHTIPLATVATLGVQDGKMVDDSMGEVHSITVGIAENRAWSTSSYLLETIKEYLPEDHAALLTAIGEPEYKNCFNKRKLKESAYDIFYASLKKIDSGGYLDDIARDLCAEIQRACDIADNVLIPSVPKTFEGYTAIYDQIIDRGCIIFYKPPQGGAKTSSAIRFILNTPGQSLVQTGPIEIDSPDSFHKRKSSKSRQWPYIIAPLDSDLPGDMTFRAAWHFEESGPEGLRSLLPRIRERAIELGEVK